MTSLLRRHLYMALLMGALGMLAPQGEAERFHATFEQHCEGRPAALRGEVQIVANPWR